MTKTPTPPLKWHGGKAYLAKDIIALAPPRCKNPNAPAADDPGYCHYVEPYFGGGAVLLANDPEGISEVVNDVDVELTNFWRVIGIPSAFERFRRRIEGTPFSEVLFDVSCLATQSNYKGHGTPEENSVDAAFGFFIRCRQSLAGRMKNFAPLTRNRTRRGMNEQASAWLNAIEGLPAVHERLKRVVILCDDALKVIRQQDGPRAWFYCDPPYVPDTRTSPDVYAHEMTAAQHGELLAVLGSIKGRFTLSGYHHVLYDQAARTYGWRCVEFDKPNNAAGGKEKRRMTECLYMNY